MSDGMHGNVPTVSVASRTLLVAGFKIENSLTQPNYREFHCERKDAFGSILRYLFALTDRDGFTEQEQRAIEASARRSSRVAVRIASTAGEYWISWVEFTEALGGSVPSWEALDGGYANWLRTSSRNEVPAGMAGEAWRLFEELVASGFEFMFGRRVVRLGGRRSGQAVSDVQAQLPSGEVLIVDAKAASEGYDAGWSQLRPLVEYTLAQRRRQSGQVSVQSAVVVSSRFHQPAERLAELSRQFLGATAAPVTFMTADSVIHGIDCLKDDAQLRNGVDWRTLLTGGLFDTGALDSALGEVASLRMGR